MKILKLTPSKLSFILILMIYSNVFKLVNLYQAVALLMEAWLLLCITYHVLTKGIRRKDAFIFVTLIFMELIGILEIFNPNIHSLYAGFLGFRKTLLMWIPFLAGVVVEVNIDDINAFIKRILVFSFPVLLYGVKQLFFYSSFDDKFITDNLSATATNNIFGQLRMTSIFSGASYLGTFAVVIVLLIIYYWKFISSKRKKIIYFTELVIALVCIYGSLSRAAAIGGLIGLAIFIFWNTSRFQKIIALCLSTFGIFVANLFFPFSQASSWIYSDNVLLRYLGSIANSQSDPRFLARYTKLEGMLNLIRRHFIIGYGVGSSQTGSKTGYYLSTRGDNLFFSYINELGIFGVLTLVIVLIVIFTRICGNIKNYKKNSFFVLSLALFISFFAMMFSATVSAMYPVIEISFSIIGIGCAEVKIKERMHEQKSSFRSIVNT